MNITASLQPENASVPEIRIASDCVPIILGFAYGRVSVERALVEKAELISDFTVPYQTLTKIRRIQLHDHQFLMFGARCVEVVGE
jgi:hypothetical protein